MRLAGGRLGQLLEALLHRLHRLRRNRLPVLAIDPADQQGALLGDGIPEQLAIEEALLLSQPGFPAAPFRLKPGLAALGRHLQAQVFHHHHVVGAIGLGKGRVHRAGLAGEQHQGHP